uniref:ATP synthase subunit 6 n=6 Tax=Echinococcus TaxID=6209 RepID=A0A2S1IZV8_ECHGR|nr:ATP synthase F0 subunit 6 [Echinococcus granulosus sensu lato genotype G7]AAL55468.1 ATPase subunit 6 [Echinococcus canadensis]AWF71547.1 ATP synthase subunit 6 [Echinococcus granulosus]AWW03915.1 ATPase subunit 6 [Echinococcus granulosus sensu lato genotype G6]QDX19078.1 ATPase subunit 6 [Echinococcus granulosus sensu lato G6/G7]AHH81837.1 ATP synthase subunit 6 [Echinococcus canadensis]
MIVVNDFGSLMGRFYVLVLKGASYYYFVLLMLVLFWFLVYRLPYCYSFYLFFVFLFGVVFVMFVSLFMCRVFSNVNSFFASFVPLGTPLYICFIVCVAESISYVIRPIVLILRPFINISLGCFGAVALGNLCFVSCWWVLILVLLFFYEVFVASIHWFIVSSILDFSVDH